MELIYSKVDASLLLHIVHRKDNIINERNNIIPGHEPLQLATMNLPAGKTFKAHKHHMRNTNNPYTRAQESWVILSGKVKAILYDIDDNIIAEPILEAGDCSITLMGGHTYEILEPSKVLEYKTGPYLGQELDKTFI